MAMRIVNAEAQPHQPAPQSRHESGALASEARYMEQTKSMKRHGKRRTSRYVDHSQNDDTDDRSAAVLDDINQPAVTPATRQQLL
jgi:hypothetical protein